MDCIWEITLIGSIWNCRRFANFTTQLAISVVDDIILVTTCSSKMLVMSTPCVLKKHPLCFPPVKRQKPCCQASVSSEPFLKTPCGEWRVAAGLGELDGGFSAPKKGVGSKKWPFVFKQLMPKIVFKKKNGQSFFSRNNLDLKRKTGKQDSFLWIFEAQEKGS